MERMNAEGLLDHSAKERLLDWLRSSHERLVGSNPLPEGAKSRTLDAMLGGVQQHDRMRRLLGAPLAPRADLAPHAHLVVHLASRWADPKAPSARQELQRVAGSSYPDWLSVVAFGSVARTLAPWMDEVVS